MEDQAIPKSTSFPRQSFDSGQGVAPAAESKVLALGIGESNGDFRCCEDGGRLCVVKHRFEVGAQSRVVGCDHGRVGFGFLFCAAEGP